MSDKRPSADYYRQRAADLEQLAQQTQSPEIRHDLLDLAERFRRMAERRKQEAGR